jgi:hypothetical protein
VVFPQPAVEDAHLRLEGQICRHIAAGKLLHGLCRL